MKKRFLALALGTLAFGVTLGGVKMGLGHQDALMVKAGEVKETVYKSLLFPADKACVPETNQYDGTITATKEGDSYSIKGFSNNNWGWDNIRCGRKKYASTNLINTNFAINKAVSKVTLDLDGTPESATSIKLFAADNDKFTNKTLVGEFTCATGKQNVTVSPWLTNQYYSIEFICQKKSNGYLYVKGVSFWVSEEQVSESPINSISLKEDPSFANDQFKGDKFDTTGLSVVATHDDESTSTISTDQVKWYLKEDPKDVNPIPFLDENGTILETAIESGYYLCAEYNGLLSTDACEIYIHDKILVSQITISLETSSVEANKSVSARIDSIAPNNATSKDVEWHVVDESVASIDSTGKVTGLKAGKTEIYATAKDKGAVESNKVEITVTEYEAKTYHQIAVEQVDYSGTYLLGYKASATEIYTWNGIDENNGYNTAAFADGVLTGNEKADASYIVLERLFDGKTLKGYTAKLVDGTGTELYFNHTSNSYNGFDMDAKEKACYQVEFAKDGVDIFVPNGPHLRFNSASNQMRFRFYKSGSYAAQEPVQLYRLDYTADVAVNAKAFADKFVAAPICGTDDNTPAKADEFEKLVKEYSGLSLDVRAYLANRDGKGDASFDAFYDKYDAIMEKRASNTEFYDFLAGKYRPAKTRGVFGINQNVTDSTTWTLVGIGAVTIAASASLLFFRRKKSN